MDHLRKIIVVGAGAVGCYFGAKLAQANADVTLLARPAAAAVLNASGLMIESAEAIITIPVSATDDVSCVRDSDLTLLCVKSYDTAAAAESLRPYLRPDAIVLSLQNGIDNPSVFAAATKIEPIPAVVYVAAQMQAPNHLICRSPGSLVIGAAHPDAFSIAALFDSAGVPCRVSTDIALDLWNKLVINSVFNGVSACTMSLYGSLVANPAVRELLRNLTEECLAVAHAEGISLAAEAVHNAITRIGESMPNALSSTAQDIQRGKRTEIDALNGTIVRLAAQHGLSAVANQAIYALVKRLESTSLRS